MINIHELLKRWKADFDFKTILSAMGSLFITTVFALYNGFLGVYHSSLWNGAICLYYLILVLLRGFIILAERSLARLENPNPRRSLVYRLSSLLLLFLNISLIVPVTMMVKLQKPVHLTLIPAIAMAAYTTYKITMSSINLKRRKKSADSLVKLLRAINFIDALVSVLTLQNTLIMVTTPGGDAGMIPFTSLSSALILIGILCLSVFTVVQGFSAAKN